MEFLILLVLIVIGYMLWRVMDQLPDVVFRLSEIQRDVAEVRRSLQEQNPSPQQTAPAGAAAPQDSLGGASSPQA